MSATECFGKIIGGVKCCQFLTITHMSFQVADFWVFIAICNVVCRHHVMYIKWRFSSVGFSCLLPDSDLLSCPHSDAIREVPIPDDVVFDMTMKTTEEYDLPPLDREHWQTQSHFDSNQAKHLRIKYSYKQVKESILSDWVSDPPQFQDKKASIQD